jgi:Cu(I)/Ag(I) efflux system membrane fusion protein
MTSERPEPVEVHAPIRGLFAMAIVRWVLLVATAAVAAGTWWMLVLHAEPAAELGEARFYCPMHPQIRSHNPGTCPICFMTLVPIPKDEDEHPAPPPSGSAAAPAPLASIMLTLERRQAIGVATTPVTKRRASRELELPAVIETPEKAVSEVRTRTSGFVERVAPLETGQWAKPGEALVWLFSPEVVRAEEELFAARRLDSTALGGSRDGGNSLEAAARARLEALGLSGAAVARIAEKGETQRLFTLHTQGGVVTQRNVSVGTYATPEMLLFQVTDLSRVWASASVPASDVSEVTVGTRGEFRTRGTAGGVEAEAMVVEPRVSSDTRSARVRFGVKNEKARFLPGQNGEIVLRLPERERVLVPRDAVVDVGDARYAFVEKSAGLFVPRAVEVGALIGEERVIESGLEPGELVVTRGLFLLDSESRLKASLATDPSKAGKKP